MNFKKGDKILRLENAEGTKIVKGAIYTFKSYVKSYPDRLLIEEMSSKRPDGSWDAFKFKKANSEIIKQKLGIY